MIVELPNGNLVNVDDKAPPEVIARLKALNPATPQSQQRHAVQVQAAAGPTDADKHKMADAYYTRHMADIPLPFLPSGAPGGTLDAARHGIERGVGLNFDDELSGAVRAAMHAFGGDPAGAVPAYLQGRNERRAENRMLTDEHPLTSAASEIAGSLISPVGKIGKLAEAIPAASRAAQFMSEAPGVVKAAGVGAGYGAVNAAGASENDTLGSAVHGAGVGAITGGIMGGTTDLVGRLAQILANRAPGNATRSAYMVLNDLLGKAGKSPERAALEMDRAARGGNSAALMDISPGTRAVSGALARNPELANSNRIVDFAQNRLENRSNLLDAKIKELIDPAGGHNSDELAASITGARKAAGATDYKETYDAPLAWNDNLDQIINGVLHRGPDGKVTQIPNPYVQQALAKAKEIGRGEDLDPLKHSWVYDSNVGGGPEINFYGHGRDSAGVGANPMSVGKTTLTPEGGPVGTGGSEALTRIQTPTMRTWDLLKRGFDAEIKQAIDSGDMNKARILSQKLSGYVDEGGNSIAGIKSELSRINPTYADTLARQRDFYQQAEALQVGQTVLSRAMKPNNEARRVLTELQALPKDKADVARTGIADAITGMRNNKRDPVAVLNQMLRNPDQRSILEFAVGSPGKMDKLQRWLSNETEATRADIMSAPGRQSATNALGQAQDYFQGHDPSNLIYSAVRGYGFGGSVGAAGNFLRTVNSMRSGMSTHAQEELARLLIRKDGKALVSGVHEARDHQDLVRLLWSRRGATAAKGAQQIPTGITAN